MEKGPNPLQKGDNHRNVKLGSGVKNLLQNHWANVYQA
jgi:hypothetical protein